MISSSVCHDRPSKLPLAVYVCRTHCKILVFWHSRVYATLCVEAVVLFHDDCVSMPHWRVAIPWELEKAWRAATQPILPDCRVGIKESESEDYSSWTHWQHVRQLTFPLWQYEFDIHVTRQAVSESRTAGLRWLQVCAWRDHSYIAWISLLGHGLTVKLSPCLCSHM